MVKLYCFTIVRWSRVHNIDIAKWPNLKAYMDRVASRPKVQEALEHPANRSNRWEIPESGYL